MHRLEDAHLLRNSPTTRRKQPALASANEGDSFLKKLVERLTGKKLPPESQLFDETPADDSPVPGKETEWRGSNANGSVRKGKICALLQVYQTPLEYLITGEPKLQQNDAAEWPVSVAKNKMAVDMSNEPKNVLSALMVTIIISGALCEMSVCKETTRIRNVF